MHDSTGRSRAPKATPDITTLDPDALRQVSGGAGGGAPNLCIQWFDVGRGNGFYGYARCR